jgi:phage-related protein
MGMERVIKFYETEGGESPVRSFLRDLDDHTLAKVLAVFKLIESQTMVSSKYFKKFSGYDLWECRVEYGGRIYRFPAFWDKGSLIILTHGFEKKSQKTPEKEIKKALDYKADWQRRTK